MTSRTDKIMALADAWYEGDMHTFGADPRTAFRAEVQKLEDELVRWQARALTTEERAEKAEAALAQQAEPVALPKVPDPALINSMAMRYRHDFGLLDQREQDSIRTTMRQLWEEVVGLGFYRAAAPATQQQAEVQRLRELLKDVRDLVPRQAAEVIDAALREE